MTTATVPADPARPRRLAQRRGVLTPRQHPGHTLAEYQAMQEAGQLDRRMNWVVYQVADSEWLVARGRDRAEHLLGYDTLVPRRFRSAAEAMSQVRDALAVTSFTVDVLPDARITTKHASRAERAARKASAEASQQV